MKLIAKFDKSTKNYVKIALDGFEDMGIIGSKDSPCIYLRPDTLKSIKENDGKIEIDFSEVNYSYTFEIS